MIRGIVYLYVSPSGKPYVGQTVDERRRRSNWFSANYEYAGVAINRARAKYGRDAFTYTVLFSHLFHTKEEATSVLNIMEKYYIEQYDSKKHGYNCEYGGKNHAGYKVSEDGKKNISKGVRSWMSTPEGRVKMSLAKRGKTKKRGYKILKKSIPIVQLSLDGGYIQEFQSIIDATHYINPLQQKSNISVVCNGKRDSAYGYKWMYKDDYYSYFLHTDRCDIPDRVKRALAYINERRKNVNRAEKPKSFKEKLPRISKFARQVGQYDLKGNLVKVWRASTDAGKELCISVNNINRAIRTLGCYKDYFWRVYCGEQTCSPKPKKHIVKPKAWKKVAQLDLEGNVIAVYDSIGLACDAVHAKHRALLSRCLNKKAATAYGYMWKFSK